MSYPTSSKHIRTKFYWVNNILKETYVFLYFIHDYIIFRNIGFPSNLAGHQLSLKGKHGRPDQYNH